MIIRYEGEAEFTSYPIISLAKSLGCLKNFSIKSKDLGQYARKISTEIKLDPNLPKKKFSEMWDNLTLDDIPMLGPKTYSMMEDRILYLKEIGSSLLKRKIEESLWMFFI